MMVLSKSLNPNFSFHLIDFGNIVFLVLEEAAKFIQVVKIICGALMVICVFWLLIYVFFGRES